VIGEIGSRLYWLLHYRRRRYITRRVYIYSEKKAFTAKQMEIRKILKSDNYTRAVHNIIRAAYSYIHLYVV